MNKVVVSNEIEIVGSYNCLQNNEKDNGAKMLLEGLQTFAEEMLDNYEHKETIPYDKLFSALKQVIDSASDNRDVRNGVMTGIVQFKKVPKKKLVEPKAKTEKAPRIKHDKEEVLRFAETHSNEEVMLKFGFTSIASTKANLTHYRKDLGWVATKKGGRESSCDLNAIIEAAPNHTVKELSLLFGMTTSWLNVLLRRNNIECRRK